jgi:hypothetical protein
MTTAAGAAAALAVCGHSEIFAQDAVLDTPAIKNGVAREKILWKVQPFPMAQVKLRSGPFKEMMEINRTTACCIPFASPPACLQRLSR